MASELQFQSVVTIHLSDEERLSQTINAEHAGMTVAAMHRDGIVVLENAVDVEHVDKLNDILSSEADTMAQMPTTHFNDVSFEKIIESFPIIIVKFRFGEKWDD
jgi:hypothetical protein